MAKSRQTSKSSRLLVGNLPMESSDADIYDLLSKVGDVRHIEILCNPKNGKPLGFAQVEMQNYEHAQLVVQLVDGMEMQGRKLSVQPVLTEKRQSFLGGLLEFFGAKTRSI